MRLYQKLIILSISIGFFAGSNQMLHADSAIEDTSENHSLVRSAGSLVYKAGTGLMQHCWRGTKRIVTHPVESTILFTTLYAVTQSVVVDAARATVYPEANAHAIEQQASSRLQAFLGILNKACGEEATSVLDTMANSIKKTNNLASYYCGGFFCPASDTFSVDQVLSGLNAGPTLAHFWSHRPSICESICNLATIHNRQTWITKLAFAFPPLHPGLDDSSYTCPTLFVN